MADFYKLENNVYTYLNEDIDENNTSIRVKKAVSPFNDPIAPSSSEIGALTLIDNHESTTKIEIINFTGFTDNGDGTLTILGITRGKENTLPQKFVKGSIVTQALTRDAINNIINNINNIESDWEGSAAYTISISDIDNWNEAFSWGDHSTYGYLTNITNESIGDLEDVVVKFAIENGDVLRFNSSTGDWESGRYTSSEFSHNNLQDVSINEHIDWTLDQNGDKYINKNNIKIIDGGIF